MEETNMLEGVRRCAIALAILCVIATFSTQTAAQVTAPPPPAPVAQSGELDSLIAEYEAVDTTGPSVMLGVDLAFFIAGAGTFLVGAIGGMACEIGGTSISFGTGSSSSSGDCGGWWITAAVGGGTAVVAAPLWIAGLVWLAGQNADRRNLRREIEARGGRVALDVVPWASSEGGGAVLRGSF